MTTEQLLREALVIHLEEKKRGSPERAQAKLDHIKAVIPTWLAKTNARLAKLPADRRATYLAAFLHAVFQLNNEFRDLIEDELNPAEAPLMRRLRAMIDEEAAKLAGRVSER